MLKITLHDRPESLCFQLEGRLVGPWVREFEESWTTASSVRESRGVVVDLSDVTFIDDAGRRLLERLSNKGARFVASDPMTQSIVARFAARAGQVVLVLAAFLLAIFSFTAHAQTTGQNTPGAVVRLTLKEAVQTALKQNPQIAIANLNIAESQENTVIARAGLLPQIGLNASEAVRRANIEAQMGRRFPSFPQHIGPFWMIQGGPTFSIPIFDLTLLRRWRASRQDVDTARAQYDSVREQYVLLVVSQYLSGLRAQADITAAQSRVDLAKALLDLASDMLKNGVGTRIDMLRADVQYHNEQQRLISAQTQLQTALFGLGRLLNLDPAASIQLEDSVAFFATPAFSAERTLEAAYQARPEMRAIESRITSLELQQRAALDQRLPRLSVTGAWAEQGLSLSSAIPTYNYQVSVDVPLFTGGRIRSQTAIADIETRKAEQERQDVRNRIALEVRTAAAQLDAARNEVDVANRGIALAQEELEQARDRFRAGVANNIEVITAQDELSRANDNQIAALYRYNQARADLARATGHIETLYTQ